MLVRRALAPRAARAVARTAAAAAAVLATPSSSAMSSWSLSSSSMMRKTMVVVVMCAMAWCEHAFLTAQATQYKDYVQSGFPTVSFVSSVLLLAASVYATKNSSGGFASLSSNRLFVGLNLTLAIFGLLLLFGPDSNARAASIGIQLVPQAALAFVTVSRLSSTLINVYLLFAVFNYLSLMGSHTLFNYTTPIWELNTGSCSGYFGEATIDRCKDDGYLMFLRLLGNIAIFVDLAAIFDALSLYSTINGAKPVA